MFKNESERGITLEKWITAQFVGGYQIRIDSFYIGTAESHLKKIAPFNFRVHEIVYFPDEDSITPNYEKKTLLYIPTQRVRNYFIQSESNQN